MALDPIALRDGETLLALVQELARGEALVCRQSASFARGDQWAVVGAQNAAAWIATQARCDRMQARRRIRLGHAMAWMDRARAEFVAGRIGVEHVDRLAKARDRSRFTAIAFGRDQAMLVEWALTMPFVEFTAALDVWLEHADEDEAESRAAKQCHRRRFHLSQSFENTWFADGVFDPISGQIIHDTLSRPEGELFRAEWRAAEDRLGRAPTSRRWRGPRRNAAPTPWSRWPSGRHRPEGRPAPRAAVHGAGRSRLVPTHV